ncbi:MAG: methyltransferase domain-containing protein [Elusimicrobia bacterium]|nr:methyltransferase domain-containing protein [Elusimicrobiota bacterium]
MRARLLDFLRCPLCSASLEAENAFDAGGWLESGFIVCSACHARYPVNEGIPSLLADGSHLGLAGKTSDSFSMEWLNYNASPEEDRKIFLEESQTEPEFWKGRVVLDAGCGMGRYSLVARSLGAEVVAADYSRSVLRLVTASRNDAGLHVVRCDLLQPPFKPEVFDAAYSHGVLHHTADARAAFKSVAASVKRGGYLSVWLYGKAGSWRNFRTNPLRSSRKFLEPLKFMVWIFVGIRGFYSDAMRFFTTRLPAGVCYALSYPLAWLGAVPVVKYLTFSAHRDYKIRFFENFDWISPPYQTHHTKEELAGWYEQAGFEPEKTLPHGFVPKPGVLGRKK